MASIYAIRLEDVAARLASALRRRPDLLVLNRYGSMEVAGAGLLDVLSVAIEIEKPRRNRRSRGTVREVAELGQWVRGEAAAQSRRAEPLVAILAKISEPTG